VHEHETGQFRRLVAGHYVVWYRLRTGGDILVLGIRHGRRQPLNLAELERRVDDQ
jgi:plasmid stabilization system protein ParE